MAKTVKTVSPTVSSLNGDMATIARDFATFGQFTVNNDARTALLRRVSDAETFKAIRLAALEAWLIQKGYTAKDARANVDGSLANPKAFGNGAKRTEAQQVDYKRANAAWQYYLTCNGIASLTRAPSARKPSMVGDKAAPQAKEALTENSAKAPPAALSAVMPIKGDIDVTLDQFANASALMSRVTNINAKTLTGNRGMALRELALHNAREIKRIQAMKD